LYPFGRPRRGRYAPGCVASRECGTSENAEDGTTKIHVRFKGGRVETLTTTNPKPSWEKVKTAPHIIAMVDELIDDHLYAEIARRARGHRDDRGGADAARAQVRRRGFARTS
jgi:uncharacterized OB-fold protein